MKRLMTALLCGALATSMAVPAGAQSYNDRNAQYQNDRSSYDAQMSDYNAAKAQYERDRAAYDRRYGRGAYERYNGRFDRPVPAYDDRYAGGPNGGPGYGGPGYGPSSSCAQAKSDAKGGRAAGTILGALIGGAIGSNVAAGGHRGDGTALGAVVGGVIGNKVGGDTKAGAYSAACDANGYYYSYDQTYPYREGRDGVPRGQYNSRYYSDRNCRLAPAQGDNGEYRYMRVCPDSSGRYRTAG
jgi:hypothetical protein